MATNINRDLYLPETTSIRAALELLSARPTRARADHCAIAQPKETHARRKAVYEKLHPEAKRGALGGKGINADILTDKLSVRNESYAADAANAVGETERTVRRKTRIGEQLAEVAEQYSTC